MSWKKFILYCAVQKVDLYSVGVNPEAVIKLYRETHPQIVSGWKKLHDACHKAAEGTDSFACRCEFTRYGKDVRVELPSRRSIVYRNARIEPRIPGYAKLFGTPADMIPTFVFDHPHGYEGYLYGGRLMENIVQAVCRDILVDRLIQVENSGLLPFLHVHDEICTESEAIQELAEIMSTPPEWAPDFPILVECFSHHRYMKSPPKSAPSCAGLNGEVR